MNDLMNKSTQIQSNLELLEIMNDAQTLLCEHDIDVPERILNGFLSVEKILINSAKSLTSDLIKEVK